MWENLHKIFVFLRYDIENINNSYVIDIMINVLNNDDSNEKMCNMIFQIMPKWKEQLIVNADEEEQRVCYIQLKQYIIKTLELIKNNILVQNFEMAYDIVDMLQGLPVITEINRKKELKQYWKIYVMPFQKKWKVNLFYDWKEILCN